MSSKCVLRSNNIDLDSRTLDLTEIKCLREDFVIPEDIHDVFFAVASHRVRMNARAKAEGATLNNLLSMVLRQVPVPKVNP